MRTIAAALLLSALLGLPAFGVAAQQANPQDQGSQQPDSRQPIQAPGSGQDPVPGALQDSGSKDSTGDTLARDRKVQESQDPMPTDQGNKSPNQSSSAATGSGELQQALAAVRRAPPDLNGTPVPRPNQWASEPDQPNEPTRSQNPSDLSSQEIK